MGVSYPSLSDLAMFRTGELRTVWLRHLAPGHRHAASAPAAQRARCGDHRVAAASAATRPTEKMCSDVARAVSPHPSSRQRHRDKRPRALCHEGWELAVLGYGFIADLHVRAAQVRSLTVQVVAGHNPTGRAASLRIQTHSIQRSTTDWMAAGHISTTSMRWSSERRTLCTHPQALMALAAGKHVLVEKPMATTRRRCSRHDRGRRTERSAPAGRAHVALPRRGHRHGASHSRRRHRAAVVRTRGDGIHAGWGTERLVHRPGPCRRRSADRHGHPRHRHSQVPAR